MMQRVARHLRPVLIQIYRGFAPVLAKLGFDSKGWYELAYWRAAQQREGTLGNEHYQAIYTTDIELDPGYYVGKKLLDIGCGPRGSLEWADMAAERVGLDPLVSQYRKLGIQKHAMQYIDAPAEKIPYPDGYFDVVTSVNSLDHVDNLQQSIAEIIRVLAKGGEFLLITHVHDEPTIAEPVLIPWTVTNLFQPVMMVVQERHYELSPAGRSAILALRTGIPFDHKRTERRYGVLFARLRKMQA
jgi:SAM-dependent methyltransferase